VAAGYISTGMVQARPEGGAGQGYRQKSRSGGSASGRGGRVVEFLADPDSASITGQI